MKLKELYTPPHVGVYVVSVERTLALSYNQVEQTETLYVVSDEEDL